MQPNGRMVHACIRPGSAGMTIRSRRETVTFKHPFQIRGIDRMLPARAYEVITDEEMVSIGSGGCSADRRKRAS